MNRHGGYGSSPLEVENGDFVVRDAPAGSTVPSDRVTSDRRETGAAVFVAGKNIRRWVCEIEGVSDTDTGDVSRADRYLHLEVLDVVRVGLYRLPFEILVASDIAVGGCSAAHTVRDAVRFTAVNQSCSLPCCPGGVYSCAGIVGGAVVFGSKLVLEQHVNLAGNRTALRVFGLDLPAFLHALVEAVATRKTQMPGVTRAKTLVAQYNSNSLEDRPRRR